MAYALPTSSLQVIFSPDKKLKCRGQEERSWQSVTHHPLDNSLYCKVTRQCWNCGEFLKGDVPSLGWFQGCQPFASHIKDSWVKFYLGGPLSQYSDRRREGRSVLLEYLHVGQHDCKAFPVISIPGEVSDSQAGLVSAQAGGGNSYASVSPKLRHSSLSLSNSQVTWKRDSLARPFLRLPKR